MSIIQGATVLLSARQSAVDIETAMRRSDGTFRYVLYRIIIVDDILLSYTLAAPSLCIAAETGRMRIRTDDR